MKRLELIFENEAGKNVTFTLDEPVDPVNPEAIHQAMDEIIAQNVFTTNDGDVIAKKGARIVERTVTPIDIEQ